MGMFFMCVFMNVVYYLLIPFFLCYLLHFLLVCLIIYAFFVCVCLLHSKTMSYTKPVRYNYIDKSTTLCVDHSL